MIKFERDGEGHSHYSFDGSQLINVVFAIALIIVVVKGLPAIEENGLQRVLLDIWCGQNKDC